MFTAKHVGTLLRHLVSLMTSVAVDKTGEIYYVYTAKLNNEVPPHEPYINTTCVCLSPPGLPNDGPILNLELLMQCKHTFFEKQFYLPTLENK